MKSTLNKLFLILQIVSALCMIGAIKVWAPVCGKLLELANGNQVPMKCHWAGQTAIAVSIIILAAAFMALLSKTEYKKIMVINAVAAIMLFGTFSGLIGVCANETMRCQSTKVWGMIIAALVFATSLFNLLSGKEGQIPD